MNVKIFLTIPHGYIYHFLYELIYVNFLLAILK